VGTHVKNQNVFPQRYKLETILDKLETILDKALDNDRKCQSS